jgi:hypothetical protein
MAAAAIPAKPPRPPSGSSKLELERYVRKTGWVAGGLILLSANVQALDYQWDEVSVNLSNRLSVGVAMRMRKPGNNLLGKLNVPGQQNLRAADDCLSFVPALDASHKLVDAGGAFSALTAT